MTCCGCMMTRRLPCPAAPGQLEGYAARFDDLFGSLAQRRDSATTWPGCWPRGTEQDADRTSLAARAGTGAQHPAVQRLQFFLPESRWDFGQVNARRLELLRANPATAPHGGGVLVIDDSGDRKDGMATAHVGRQRLGRYGTARPPSPTLWVGERVYYPVYAVPYTPARHFAAIVVWPLCRSVPLLDPVLGAARRRADRASDGRQEAEAGRQAYAIWIRSRESSTDGFSHRNPRSPRLPSFQPQVILARLTGKGTHRVPSRQHDRLGIKR